MADSVVARLTIVLRKSQIHCEGFMSDFLQRLAMRNKSFAVFNMNKSVLRVEAGTAEGLWRDYGLRKLVG